MSDDIFREVNEEVRRDQAVKFWKQHSGRIFAAVAVVLIAAGGYRAYDFWHTRLAQKAGARYELALQLAHEGKPDDAQRQFEALAQRAPGGYRVLARFQMASETAKQDPA